MWAKQGADVTWKHLIIRYLIRIFSLTIFTYLLSIVNYKFALHYKLLQSKVIRYVISYLTYGRMLSINLYIQKTDGFNVYLYSKLLCKIEASSGYHESFPNFVEKAKIPLLIS